MNDLELQNRLKEYLIYNELTGEFTFKYTNLKHNAGAIAGHINGAGYRYIRFAGAMYGLHRLAILYVEGRLPDNSKDVDHIDGVKLNNAYSNLREVTRSENLHNRSIYGNNSSGHKGVSFQSKTCKWLGSIQVNGSRKFTSRFSTKEEAIEALTLLKQQHLM